MKIILNIHPLSINKAFFGKHIKTPECRNYEKYLSGMLLQFHKPGELSERVRVIYKFYLKSIVRSDADNYLKLLNDILVKSGFIKDDRYIMEYHIYKIKAEHDSMEIDIENIKSSNHGGDIQ
jgi:Holliday junction resolvase RusA-like endonuclease